MSLAAPGLLVFLLVVVLMGFIAWRIARWRIMAREAFAGPQASHWRQAFSVAATVFLLEAAVLIVIAMARPEWGSTELTRDREGVDVVIVLDISQSMQGTDVEPTRLGLAQQQLGRLIEAERGSRFGLVIFAGSAILRSPLTTDTSAMTELINRAGNEGGLLRSGSDLGAALEQASAILTASENTGKAVLVISDGEDFANTFADRARTLRENNILVLTAGVGTTEGSQLFDINRLGTPVPKVGPNNQPVVTRINEANLRAAAEAGSGRYVHIDNDSNLLTFREDLARLERAPLGSETQNIPVQRFQVFVAAALLLLVASWFVRLRLEPLKRLATRVRLRPQPGIAMIVLALVAGACSDGNTLRSLNQEATDAYNRGDYEEALDLYQRLIARRPDMPELSYNAGNVLHRQQQYERAIETTQRALPPIDDEDGAVTYYALGNHFFRLEEYELAYDAYRNALILNPKDADAKYNLELTYLILTGQAGEEQQPGEQPGEQGGQPGGEPSDPQDGQPGEPGEPQDGQPQEGEPSDPTQPGQGSPSTIPPEQQTPSSEVLRELQEALRGLNENLTYEEAQRILDLLQQQQQGDRLPGGGTPLGPDY